MGGAAWRGRKQNTMNDTTCNFIAHSANHCEK